MNNTPTLDIGKFYDYDDGKGMIRRVGENAYDCYHNFSSSWYVASVRTFEAALAVARLMSMK